MEDRTTWNGIKTFSWSGHDWIARPLWGEYHPEEDDRWFSEDTFRIDPEGNLNLFLIKKSNKFITPENDSIYPIIGIPFIRSVEEFKYGVFSWDCVLPEGKFLWPALWLASDYSWPPEIDCMEGWSGESVNYVKGLFWKNVHPTMHWSDNKNTHCMEAKYNVCRLFVKGGEKTNHFEVTWTPNKVLVKYNNVKIKEFTNPEMLKQLNDPNVKMHVVMDLNFEPGFIQNSNARSTPENGILSDSMIVKNFKYLPLK